MLGGSKKSTTQPKSVTIERWGEADVLLARAVARFLDTSTFLEAQCTTRDGSSYDLVIRIGSSLNYLQTTIDQQLRNARLALARTHNRFNHSILALPGEILSEIFLYVVYDPVDEKDPCNYAINMEKRVEMIYRRLHSMLAVCVSWRNTGIACGALWSVVPVVDPRGNRLRPLSTKLSLQRAGANGLHLAISLLHQSQYRLSPLKEHLSRFTTINIDQKTCDTAQLPETLSIILRDFKPGILSKLSLEGATDNAGLVDRGYYDPDPLDIFSQPDLAYYKPTFTQLIQSLSALRIHSVTLDWRRMAFSPHLAVLRIGNISLGAWGIPTFISALSSANELRELELASIRALVDEDRTKPPPRKLIFPKLESLYLGDLNFNFLQLFTKVISTGAYYLTVSLTVESCASYSSAGWDSDDSDEPYDYNDHTCEEICDMLRAVPINKIILAANYECPWTEIHLHALLKAVPTVKTLVLNDWTLSPDTLKALKQPPRPSRWADTDTRNDVFPRLETIEFHYVEIPCPLSDLKSGFKDLFASHPVQRMVIGTYPCESGDSIPIDQHDEVLAWLKSKIPRFLFHGDQPDIPTEFVTWQLWDI